MKNKFFKNFDKTRFSIVSKMIFVLACLVCIVNLMGNTYTRYESRVDINADANVAFFVIDQGTYESSISLDGLIPSDDPKYYTFYVANYKNDRRTDVDLEYTIKFETTTNLPLSYEIVRNETFATGYTNIISSSSVRQDDYDVFYKVFEDNHTYEFSHNANQIDQYTLKVTFPLIYKNNPDYYQGMIEMFSIIVDAKQKISV